MSRIRAVLLDLYDTLVWSEWPAMRAELEERLGVPAEGLLRAFITTRPARSVGTFGSAAGDVAAVLEAAGAPTDPALVAELTEHMQGFLTTGVMLHEDSLPAVRELRAAGVATVLVSNCDHTTEPVVRRLGLHDEMDAVVLSFQVGVAKPDPGIYLEALDRVGAAPDEAVFVDDQVGYCDGARAVGTGTYLIMREHHPRVEAAAREAGHPLIRDLRTLPELVAGG